MFNLFKTMDADLKKLYEGKFKEHGTFSIYSKDFDKSYDHIQDDHQFLSIKTVTRSSAKMIGMVIYGDVSFYFNEKEKDEDNHLAGVSNEEGRSFYLSLLSDYFYYCFGERPKQIVAGHEHGDNNGKCHLQLCISFDDVFRGTIRPGFFEFLPSSADFLGFSGKRFLFMAQKARNPRALTQYCMKDGDFFYLNPNDAIKYVHKKDSKGEETEKIDAFATIYKNKALIDVDQAKDLILTHEPRTGFTMYKNLEYAFNSELAAQIPPLQWIYPEHLKGKYPLIEKWFNTWCVTEDLRRRKSLLLYSKKRCLGKTEFACSLVNDPRYAVIFRNSFVDCLKDKVPKLLVMDDMTPYTQQNKETWKALVASQPTAIRDAYLNINWEYRLPCIITTNNLFLVSLLRQSSDFNTQIIFHEIDEYMGPPGTEPKDMFDVEEFFSIETNDALQNMMRSSEEHFLKKKKERDEKNSNSLDLLNEIMRLRQENETLRNSLKKK